MRINSEDLQKIRMCVQTYINLNGTMPTPEEMIDWLGVDYTKAVLGYMGVTEAA